MLFHLNIQLLSEVIGSVNVVNLKILKKTSLDLKDLLETTPGVTVSRDFNSGRTFNDGIYKRYGQRVNFLLTELELEVYVGYDDHDTSLLKRVKFLKDLAQHYMGPMVSLGSFLSHKGCKRFS